MEVEMWPCWSWRVKISPQISKCGSGTLRLRPCSGAKKACSVLSPISLRSVVSGCGCDNQPRCPSPWFATMGSSMPRASLSHILQSQGHDHTTRLLMTWWGHPCVHHLHPLRWPICTSIHRSICHRPHDLITCPYCMTILLHPFTMILHFD